MTNDSPMISVMILCYNYGHMLSKALDACAAQTFKDFEIVMVNNGSTDNTEEVYQGFCQAHPDIRTVYVHVEPNRGPTNGWNQGLKNANGEYVLFNDADDWMEPDCLAFLAQKARETGADRVTGQYREVRPDGTVARVRSFGRKDVQIPTTMLQGTIFRRSVIEENGLRFPAEFFVTYDGWFTYNFAILEKAKCRLVREVVYNYYTNVRSITMNIASLDTQYQKTFEPYIVFSRELMDKTADPELRAQMQYFMLRCVFSSIVSGYMEADKKTADAYYMRLRKKLEKEHPGYYKNPLLWRINNGYEAAGGVACMVVALLDRLKCVPLLYLAARLGKKSSFTRK